MEISFVILYCQKRKFRFLTQDRNNSDLAVIIHTQLEKRKKKKKNSKAIQKIDDHHCNSQLQKVILQYFLPNPIFYPNCLWCNSLGLWAHIGAAYHNTTGQNFGMRPWCILNEIFLMNKQIQIIKNHLKI